MDPSPAPQGGANRQEPRRPAGAATKNSERTGFFDHISIELPIIRDAHYCVEDLRQPTRGKEARDVGTDPSNNKSDDSSEGLSRWGKCINVACDLARLAIGGGAVVGGALFGVSLASLVTASAPLWLSGGLAVGGALVAYCWLANPLSDLVHVIASSVFSPGAWQASSRFQATDGKIAGPSSAPKISEKSNDQPTEEVGDQDRSNREC